MSMKLAARSTPKVDDVNNDSESSSYESDTSDKESGRAQQYAMQETTPVTDGKAKA